MDAFSTLQLPLAESQLLTSTQNYQQNLTANCKNTILICFKKIMICEELTCREPGSQVPLQALFISWATKNSIIPSSSPASWKHPLISTYSYLVKRPWFITPCKVNRKGTLGLGIFVVFRQPRVKGCSWSRGSNIDLQFPSLACMTTWPQWPPCVHSFLIFTGTIFAYVEMLETAAFSTTIVQMCCMRSHWMPQILLMDCWTHRAPMTILQ